MIKKSDISSGFFFASSRDSKRLFYAKKCINTDKMRFFASFIYKISKKYKKSIEKRKNM